MNNQATTPQPATRSLPVSLKLRKSILLMIDLMMYCAAAVVFMALYKPDHLFTLSRMLQFMILISSVMLIRYCFRTYHQVWRYATSREYLNVVLSDLNAGILYLLLSRLFLPVSLQVMFWQALALVSVGCLATISARFLYQCMHELERENPQALKASCGFVRYWLYVLGRCVFSTSVLSGISPADSVRAIRTKADASATDAKPSILNKVNIAIVGAGSLGVLLARELTLNKESHYYPYCFIDMDSQKIGNVILGQRVYPEDGIIQRLRTLPVQEVIIAIPNLNGDEKHRLYDFYRQSNCKVKLYDYPFGNENSGGAKRVLREFGIEDLLSREVVDLDVSNVTHVYQGKTILITGGGGSIGSELCRQLAKLKPAKLIIFDIYENAAYEIEQELRGKYGDNIRLSIEIGSVRDIDRLTEIFMLYHPQIVFHTAAHKHVPLMEHCCGEAVKNNVFGTLNTVNTAEKFGVDRFLLVSTDKAVNPTSVMGASKRLCEMIIQSKKNSRTSFMAVRFGNVLGSNGSVIPLFKKQIAASGPITLTDKRIIRYFMTISEATQLLLQACAIASTGEIYVLDMGRPVKILELAENMIRMSGLTPYVDIDIHEIGLRPGEKLYEELLMQSDRLEKTSNGMIFIEREEGLEEKELREKLEVLTRCLACHERKAIIDAMHRIVPTYQSAEITNHAYESAEKTIQYDTQKMNELPSFSHTH